KVSSIVMIGSRACRAWKPDWPRGKRRDEFDKDISEIESNWGDLGSWLEYLAPSVQDDPEERAFFNRLLIQSASPQSAVAITRLNYEVDYRFILPTIEVPALILHPENDASVSIEDGRYIADHIPNARLELVKNSDHLPWIGDTDGIVRQLTKFVCNIDHQPRENRVLATILMTDIASSTELAARLGDAKWREVIEAHDAAAARAVSRHDGTLVKTMGDGILATFSGPSRAVSCAGEIQAEAKTLGLSVRAGVHAGECLRRAGDVTGLAVTIAARILDHTPGGDAWVSSTVRDLVVGSGLEFAPMGPKPLKGVPDEWPLYRVIN
ncbi:MAG: adenylate/guanylate cyclase domain-containing protein, partial [Boseongicola sp.]